MGFNMLTGLALGIGGWFLGGWIGGQIAVGHDYLQGTDQNDVGIYMGYLFAVIGWLVGLGFANYPIGRLLGRPPTLRQHELGSWTRYFRLCTDHKVVGIQYLFGVGIFFFIGGLNAMLMRTELLRPVEKPWPAGQYLTLVSLHGTMMIMMTSAFILGPFGNYLVPIMIGARRMAFPRLESLTFWLVPAAGLILMSAIAFGGIATGWTGYAPLADEGRAGMDAYVMAFIQFGIGREMWPVSVRKPLWGYWLGVACMLRVRLHCLMVWQNNLFVSRMNAGFRPFYMLTTALISIPTGFIFLNALGTLWRARIRFTVPMLFALAFFFNFLIGGLSGVFLSDVPSDVTTHGSYFVMAHFHYTIMGGLVFAFFGAVYYWLPKMLGFTFNEMLAKIHFWMMFVFFNLTFFPLFAAGFLDMPRRVSTYAPSLQGLNDFVSVSAFLLGFSMLIFLANLIWSF